MLLPMTEPLWTDQLSAWSTFATAVLTLALVGVALWAGITAIHTLRTSQRASEAAIVAAEAARSANEQARVDSIEQTRPYVYAEIAPSLAGANHFDLKIRNSGKSAARNLTLDYSDWPAPLDDVACSIRTLFDTPRTLPPDCSIRVLWRLQGNFSDGTTEAGMPKSGIINLKYTSDDSSKPQYSEHYDVQISTSGLWPVPEAGPRPDGMSGDAKKFYVLGQALLRRVGELGR
jgi:hypothetical protein